MLQSIPSSDVPSFFITVHDDPVSFLHAVGPHLRLREELANTILPFAEAAAAVGNTTFTTTTMAASTVTAENVGPTEVRRRTNDAVDSRESASPIYDRIHWITCWSQSAPVIMNDRNSNSNTDNNGNAQIGTPSRVDFVAMYGTSRSGPTPVFLAITDRRYPRDQGSGQPHDDEFTRVAMMAMVAKLGDLTEPRSVCSVFGSMPHVDIFSRAWQAHIGGSLPLQTMVRRRSRMMCHTKGREREHALHSIQQIQAAVPGIRLATAQDTGRVAQLCQLFALAMHYPNVNADRVRQYACRMIKQRQLWVYEAQKDPEDLIIRSKEQQENAKHIISVCEVSRRSRKVVVLDKLFTAENYRGRGYATHLLRHIINHFFEEGVTKIVLYTPVDAETARCIFRRSGFIEYASQEWCEVGFAGGDANYW